MHGIIINVIIYAHTEWKLSNEYHLYRVCVYAVVILGGR